MNDNVGCGAPKTSSPTTDESTKTLLKKTTDDDSTKTLSTKLLNRSESETDSEEVFFDAQEESNSPKSRGSSLRRSQSSATSSYISGSTSSNRQNVCSSSTCKIPPKITISTPKSTTKETSLTNADKGRRPLSSLSEVDSSNEAEFLADLNSRFNVKCQTERNNKENSVHGTTRNISLTQPLSTFSGDKSRSEQPVVGNKPINYDIPTTLQESTTCESSSTSQRTNSTVPANFRTSPIQPSRSSDVVKESSRDSVATSTFKGCPNRSQQKKKSNETSPTESPCSTPSCPGDIESCSSPPINKSCARKYPTVSQPPIFTLGTFRSQIYTSSSASQATMTTSCVLDDLDADRESGKGSGEDSISAKSIILCPIYCLCSYYRATKAQLSSYCSNHMILFILCGLFALLIFNFALYSYIFYLAHRAGHEF